MKTFGKALFLSAWGLSVVATLYFFGGPPKPKPVVIQSYFDKNVTDDSLRQLADISNLDTFNAPGSSITDAGLKHLKTHTELREVDLGSTTVTDAGLEELSQFPNLESVGLSAARRITDDGIAKLANGLPKLKELRLNYTNVTDRCIEALAKSNIEVLTLTYTELTDEVFVKAGAQKGFQRLIKLDLRYCLKVTDRGIRSLKELPSLTKLELAGPITDGAIQDLAAIPNLSLLHLGKTQITAIGMTRLRKARPSVFIETTRN